MLLKYFNLILITVLLASCGGGGGTSNNSNLLPNLDSNDPVDNSIWSEASPESVGMDSISLSTAFDEAFIDGTFTQAAVVIKDSKLVYERYRGIMLRKVCVGQRTKYRFSDFARSILAVEIKTALPALGRRLNHLLA